MAVQKKAGVAISAYETGVGIYNARITRVDSASARIDSFNYGDSEVGSITTNGSSTAYNTTSGERLKDWSIKQRDYRSVIESRWVGAFKWKKNQSADFGVRAQQAYEVFPEAIHKGAERLPCDVNHSSGCWSVDYGRFAPLALWSVKDLYSMEREQKRNSASLQGELDQLRSQVTYLKSARQAEVVEISELRAALSTLKQKCKAEDSPQLTRASMDCKAYRQFLAAFAVAIFTFHSAPSFGASSPPAMLVPGQFNVSATGAATYTIPIAVPPGTAGMVPSLSLDYSSQSGDGLEGVGWTLSGLPSISRCPRTLAQDGVHGSVNYDTNDRFCMDGQRLIYINGTGSGYGTDTSQYRTEIEGFSKIVEHNAINASNAWFEVWTKSGQHMQFGNSTDSQILTVGLTTNVIRAWAINWISDTVGNYLTVTYNCSALGGACTDTDRTTYGEAYPLRIDYTGHTSSPTLSPYNSVQFIYASRTGTRPMYQAGALQQTTVVLSHIKTYQGASMVYDYQLTYRSGTNILSSRITSVTLCGVTTCLAPTTFTWQGGAGLPGMTATVNGLAQGTSMAPGDFNGDGLTDVLIHQNDNCGIWLGGNSGTFSASGMVASYTQWTHERGAWESSYVEGVPPCFTTTFNQGLRATNDFNGDGYSDVPLLQQHNSTVNGFYIHPLLNDRAGNLIQVGGSANTGVYQSLAPAGTADFNGDGLTDMLSKTGTGGNYQFALSNGDGTFNIPASPTIGGTSGVATGDFDGDGCADTVQFSTSNTVVFSSFCNSAVSSFTLPTLSSGAKITLGDFNDDGKTDILVTYPGAAGTLYLSTGTGLVAQSFSVPSDWGKYTIVVADFNGDGKQDVGLMAAGGGGYAGGTDHQIWLSTGSGFSSAGTISNPNTSDTAETPVVADWNNDGAGDIWLQKPSGDTIYTFAYVPELIIGVSNGLTGSGSPANTNISYDRINKNGSFYAKAGTVSGYPTQDIDGPLYVVSRIDAGNGLGTCNPSSSYTNCYSSTYTYTGAKVNLTGRGFLGFASVAISDLQTGIVQATNYNTSCDIPSGQSAPYLECPKLGLIDSQTKVCPTSVSACSSGAVTLNSTINTYTATNLGGTSNFVSLQQSVVASNDLNGATMPTTTTNYTYDGYGNALTVNVAVAYSGSTSYKYTTNTFSNDTTSWFLGRLLTSSVESIVGSSDLTRHSSFCYDPTTGLLISEVVEPGSLTCTSGSPGAYTLVTSYGYDPFGNRTSTTVTGGSGASAIASRTSYAGYDPVGQFQITATNALGQSEQWSYDPRFAGPTSHTGPNGLTTSWTFDDIGRQTREVRPDGTQTTYSYSYCSGVNGGTSACVSLGAYLAQASLLAPDGTTQIGPASQGYFDMLSRQVAIDTQGFDGSIIRATTNYDANGRIYQVSRPYFATAPPCSGAPCWTTNTYDTLGRVTTTTYPDTSSTTYSFNGLTTSATNSLSQTTATVMNPQGLKSTVTDATSHTTTYAYDAFGNLLVVTDPAGNTVSTVYDIRGNKTDSFDPDMGHWTYAYDALGELLSQTDAKSQVATLTYDLLGRKLTRTENGLYSSWTYGASAASHNIGQLIEAKACSNSGCSSFISDRTYSFDSQSRPIQSLLRTPTDGYDYAITYNSLNGKMASLTYPSGLVVNRTYNRLGYLTNLKDGSGAPVWQANSRDAELHLTSQTAGNGVATTQAFDPKTGLIQNQRAGSSGSVASFDYNFDTIGNLQARSDNDEGFTERFCYDSLNRLTQYNFGGSCTGGKSAAYDTIGNITSKSDTGSYSYSASGGGSTRPHAVASITGTVDGLVNPQYTYDPNGNLTCVSSGSSCSGSVGRTLTQTSFNMAASLTQGSISLQLTYDDQHQRLRQYQLTGSTATETVYLNDAASGGMSERVTTGPSTLTNWNASNWGSAPWGGSLPSTAPVFVDYITVDGQIVAQRSVQFQAPRWGAVSWNSFTWGAAPGSVWGSSASTNPPRFKWGTDPWTGPTISWSWFVLDHLGSVAVITDQGGKVIQRLSYDAWGKQRNANGTDAACGSITSSTTRGFTNQEQMPAGCAVNLNARLYDSVIGRFMSPDPIVGDAGLPGAFNRYSYVLNNPLSFTDPSGLCFLGCFWNTPIFRDVLGVAVAIALQQWEVLPELEVAAGIAPTTGAITSSVGLSAVNAAIIGGISGGIASGTIKGAGLGALSAGFFYEAGNILAADAAKSITILGSPTVDTFVSHGLVGGITSVVGGGNFASGFLAAGIGSFAPTPAQGQSWEATAEGAADSALLGGVGSVLGGGKFANGAVTGAFGYLFNDLSHLNHTVQGATAGTVIGAGTALGCDIGTVGICTLADPVIVGAGSLIGGVGGLVSDTIESGYDWLKGITYSNDENAPEPSEVAPKNAPSGTRPIDSWGIPRGDIHDIKGPQGLQAGPKDWVGITPGGDVITTGPNGEAVNNGHVDDYTNRPLKQFPRPGD